MASVSTGIPSGPSGVPAADSGSLSSFLQSGLTALYKFASKKHDALRAQCVEVLSRIKAEDEAALANGRRAQTTQRGGPASTPDSDANKYFLPLKLACDTGQAKLVAIALDTMEKLIAYGYLDGNCVAPEELYPTKKRETSPAPASAAAPATSADSSDPAAAASVAAAAPKRLLISVMIETLYDCSMYKDPLVQRQVVKAILTTVSSVSCPVHDHGLLQAVTSCYQIYLQAGDETNRTTSKAALTQIFNLVFQRMELFASQLNSLVEKQAAQAARLSQKEPASATKTESMTATTDPPSATSSGNGRDMSTSESAITDAAGGDEDSSPPLDIDTEAEAQPVEPSLGADESDGGSEFSGGTPVHASLSAKPSPSLTSRPPPGKRGYCVMCQKPANHYCLQTRDPVCTMECKHANLARKDPNRVNALSVKSKIQHKLQILQNDAYYLLRALIKLSTKTFATVPPEQSAVDSKLLSLTLLASVMQNAGPTFRTNRNFIALVKTDLVSCLLRNSAASNIDTIFTLASTIFIALMKHFKPHLRLVIGPMLDSIYLPYIQSPNSSFEHKQTSLLVVKSICEDQQLIVDLFLNYDCLATSGVRGHFASFNTFQQIAAVLEKTTHRRATGRPDEAAAYYEDEETRRNDMEETKLRGIALESLVGCMHSLAAWTPRIVKSNAQTMQELETAMEHANATSTTGGRTTALAAIGAAVIAAVMSTDANGNAVPVRNGSMSVDSAADLQLAASPSPPPIPVSTGLTLASSFSTQYQLLRAQKQKLDIGVSKFNQKPKVGIAYLQQHGLLGTEPADIAAFFHSNKNLDKVHLGEFLSDEAEFSKKVLYAYVESMVFAGQDFDESIRMFVQGFRLPGEAQKIDRMMEKFAEQYHRQNPGRFRSADTAYVLAFSIILLNTDAHNPGVKRPMTKDDFLRNSRGIDDGKDIDPVFLGEIYDRIKTNEIVMKDDPLVAADTRPKVAPAGSGDNKNRFTAFVKESTQLVRRTQDLIKTKVVPPKLGARLSTTDSKFLQEIGRDELDQPENAQPSAAAPLDGPRPGCAEDANGEPVFYHATDADAEVIRPMFEILFYPSLATFSVLLEESENEQIIRLCLDGYRSSICIANALEMQTARLAFVSSLKKFTFLGSGKEMRCLGADHEILTADGFLGLAELRGRTLDNTRPALEIVCFVPASASHPTEHFERHAIRAEDVVVKNRSWEQMIEISCQTASGRLSLRVTADHTLYAAPDAHACKPTGQDFQKFDALEIAEALQLRDLQDARTFQFKSRAAGGIKLAALPSPPPFIAELGWRADDFCGATNEVVQEARLQTMTDAFLQLYGYWLANGDLDSVGRHLSFTAHKQSDASYLDSLLSTFVASGHLLDLGAHIPSGSIGFSKAVHTAGGPCASYLLNHPAWYAMFATEYAACKPSSPKWLCPWVVRHGLLERDQLRLIVRGLLVASGDSLTEDAGMIRTSSTRFRDELVELLMYAGYTAVYDAVPVECSTHVIPSNPVSWCVHFSSSCELGSFHAKDIKNGTGAIEHTLETIWCVTVPQRDHLIVTRRKDAVSAHGVTVPSRPVIVGNSKHISAISALLGLAASPEGNHLGRDNWFEILSCISEVERLHLIANSSLTATTNPMATNINASQGNSMASVRGGVRETESLNSLQVNLLDASAIDRVFAASAHLDGEAIIDFVHALRQVSEQELANVDSPRVFSLMKMVEITYFNLGRVRVVWNRIWALLSEYFQKAGVHPDLHVSMYAIDSLRQLAMKYLDIAELDTFNFQSQFFLPFEFIMQNNPNPDIRELVLQCISRLVTAKAGNIKSGWKGVFNLLTVAGAQAVTSPPTTAASKSLLELAFTILSTVMEQHFHLISESGLESMVNCLTTFGCNQLDQTIASKSIQFLTSCASLLNKPLPAIVTTDEMLPPNGGTSQLEATPVIARRGSVSSGTSTPQVGPLGASNSQASLKVWFLVLTGLSRMVGDPRREVRNLALTTLFTILNSHGHVFSTATWRAVFHGVLLPLFDDVRYANEKHADEHNDLKKQAQQQPTQEVASEAVAGSEAEDGHGGANGSASHPSTPVARKATADSASASPVLEARTLGSLAHRASASTGGAPLSTSRRGSVTELSGVGFDHSWLQTTCFTALSSLVDLYARFHGTVHFLLPEVLKLINSCISQEHAEELATSGSPSDSLAKIGVRCLVVLLQKIGPDLSVGDWWVVLQNSADVLQRCMPKTLTSQRVRDALALPPLAAPQSLVYRSCLNRETVPAETPSTDASSTSADVNAPVPAPPVHTRASSSLAPGAPVALPFSGPAVLARIKVQLWLVEAIFQVVISFFPTHAMLVARTREDRLEEELAARPSLDPQPAAAAISSPVAESAPQLFDTTDRRITGTLTPSQVLFAADLLGDCINLTHAFNADIALRRKLHTAGLQIPLPAAAQHPPAPTPAPASASGHSLSTVPSSPTPIPSFTSFTAPPPHAAASAAAPRPARLPQLFYHEAHTLRLAMDLLFKLAIEGSQPPTSLSNVWQQEIKLTGDSRLAERRVIGLSQAVIGEYVSKTQSGQLVSLESTDEVLVGLINNFAALPQHLFRVHLPTFYASFTQLIEFASAHTVRHALRTLFDQRVGPMLLQQAQPTV